MNRTHSHWDEGIDLVYFNHDTNDCRERVEDLHCLSSVAKTVDLKKTRKASQTRQLATDNEGKLDVHGLKAW